MSRNCLRLAPRRRRSSAAARPGLTLIELLVVIAVIAALVAMLFPAIRSVRRSGDMAVELSAARQLMVGYTSYAYDNRGVLMPGYYALGQMLPVRDEAGAELEGPPVLAARYPWRLAPYLDYNISGLYLDRKVHEEIVNQTPYDAYLISLYPALGINSVFVGGDTDKYAYQPQYEALFGKFYVTRISQVRHPSNLIVFASARINGDAAQFAYPGATMVQGYFKVEPPYFTEREWAQEYDPECQWPQCAASSFGYVSLRYQFRSTVIGFFDGRADTLDDRQIQDMRHWSDQADEPEWTVKQP